MGEADLRERKLVVRLRRKGVVIHPANPPARASLGEHGQSVCARCMSGDEGLGDAGKIGRSHDLRAVPGHQAQCLACDAPRTAPQTPLMQRLRRLLPTPEMIQRNRWLRWIGPALHHPRLWHISRRGLAMGMALGIFFGLLVPLAQIPLSAAAAVALRANVPAAVASTLVTNPFTFGPVYYAAWRLGKTILGEPVRQGDIPPPPTAEPGDPPANESWWDTTRRRVLGVGKPLVVGLAVLATGVGLLTYFAVWWIWAAKVWWTRRRRLRAAAAKTP